MEKIEKMKEIYTAPKLEISRFSLTEDILSISAPEGQLPEHTEIVGDNIFDEIFGS